MFGTRQNATVDRDGIHARSAGLSPVLGGIAGTLLQNFIARKVAGRFAARAGGVPGLLVGAGITYALNRLFNGRRGTRRF